MDEPSSSSRHHQRDHKSSSHKRDRSRDRDRESSSRSRSSKRDKKDDDGDKRDKHQYRPSHHHRSHRDRSPDDERRRKEKRRRHKEEEEEERISGGMRVVDDDDDEAVWVEKDVEEGSVSTIPTAESLALKSHAGQSTTTKLPHSILTTEGVSRDAWMLESEPDREPSTSALGAYGDIEAQSTGGAADFFAALGTMQSSRKEKEAVQKQVIKEEPRFHRREINTQLMEGDIAPTTPAAKTTTPGAPGSSWRLTKLRKTYELAESSGRPIEEVALERYGSMEDFQEAAEEKRVLDERKAGRGDRGPRSNASGTSTPGGSGGGGLNNSTGERYMFTSDAAAQSGSRPGSRAGFRRPGEEPSGALTPGGAGEVFTPGGGGSRVDTLRRGSSFPSSSGGSSPIPSVLPPPRYPLPTNSKPPLSPSSLNKMQAAVLKAKLMGSDGADNLEAEYEAELQRSREAPVAVGSTGIDKTGKETRVELIPTLDGQGRLYDIGAGKEEPKILPGNRRKKEKLETHDPKTGEVVRQNLDDDTTSLGDLVRAERFGGGAADQKNLDAELANSIARDAKFTEGLDYMDENADKLARKKMKTDASKRLFAINDYARTKKALDSCLFCPKETDGAPRAGVIAMGTRSYLSLTQTEELVDGHVLIVPLQHTLTMLEGDDDVWDEVRNFMKCLMKMFAAQDKGVLFYETVLSLKPQKHSYIEAVPVPWDLFDDAPAYFREGILASETEWSQHKKLIDFSARPGGFRRALVANLPYFMVQWDYKGEKGYGHVIEGVEDSSAKQGDGEDMGAVDEGDRGGGQFPRYFAAEIIGSMLDLEPRKWRKPRRVDPKRDKERIDKFVKSYAPYDWTGMLKEQK